MFKRRRNAKLLAIILSVVLTVTGFINFNPPRAQAAITGTAYTLNDVYYSGTYYDSLGGLTGLMNGSYSKTNVLSGLRALVGYSASGSFSSSKSDTYIAAFGKTIYGTDSKHPTYSGTASGSLGYLWQTSDRKTNDTAPTGSMRLFYSSNYGTLSDLTSVTVNREHVWPQSLSGSLFGTTGAGADSHHVRPANTQLNGVRGNKAYADLSSSAITTTYYTNGTAASNYNYISSYVTESTLASSYKGTLTGYASSSYFEPIDSYKGDVARIFAYLITHYSSLQPLLGNVLIGGTDTLVSWNRLDPVDSYEIQRNNITATSQGNRNPFIDAPGLIDYIWDSSITGLGGGSSTPTPTPTSTPAPTSTPTPTPTPSGTTYTLVTSASQVTSGSEVIIVGTSGSSYYAMSNVNTTSDQLSASAVTVSSNKITNPSTSVVWTVGGSSGALTLRSKADSTKYAVYTSTSSTALNLSTTSKTYSCGTYSGKSGIYLMSSTSRGLLYNTSGCVKNYALSNVGASGYGTAMNIYVKS